MGLEDKVACVHKFGGEGGGVGNSFGGWQKIVIIVMKAIPSSLIWKALQRGTNC